MVIQTILRVGAKRRTIFRFGGRKALSRAIGLPEPYWIPQPPKLDRKGILDTLKTGVHVPGATFTNAKVTLAIRTK